MNPAGLRSVTKPASGFEAVQGWTEADLTGVWDVFRRSAVAITQGDASLRPAIGTNPTLAGVCARAVAMPPKLRAEATRRFFEESFRPVPVGPDGASGLLTGYYEPVVEGSLVRTDAFQAPILPRPDDLVTLASGERPEGVPADHSAARSESDGSLTIYPDRAALEDFALTGEARPVVWLRDWTEVFLIQVQGSAGVRLPDGTELRLVYAGRNGHPYTSIGRILIDAGRIVETAMSLNTLKAWLRDHGQAVGQEGRRIMQRNGSYIFFRGEPVQNEAGPTGGAGLPLTALRSIAVDRTLWSYGLPFWITTREPVPGFGASPLRSLFIAQDTGSAILGAARADLFLGSGDEAGRCAGLVRHAASFTALVPRAT